MFILREIKRSRSWLAIRAKRVDNKDLQEPEGNSELVFFIAKPDWFIKEVMELRS